MEQPEVGIKVRINGKDRHLSDDTPLPQLIQEMGLDPRYLVVEYNGEPLTRESFAGVRLRAGDRIELVRPVAGG